MDAAGENAPALTDVLVVALCGIVVAIYAIKRYNTPETNRLSTTRSLFLATGAGYVVTSLALFVLLSEIVLKPGVLSFLGVEDAQKVVAKYAAPSVLAALLLTTLLPNVAVISAVDAWLLAIFQGWGRIPQGVRTLADTLGQDALVTREEDLGPLRGWIERNGDVPDELAANVSTDVVETSRGGLTRGLMFYHELERLAGQPAYAAAFRTRHEVWDAIRAEFRVFAAQSHAFFVLFDHLRPVEETAGTDALKQARERYNEICLGLHQHMTVFFAQLLLMVEGSDVRIRSRVRSVGFYPGEPAYPPLPIGAFVFTGVMMVGAILGIVAVVPAPSRDLPVAMIAVLIGTTQTMGLLAAILPKLRSSSFRPDRYGHPPYLGWLASAGFAAILSFLIDRTAIALAAHTFAAGLDFVSHPISPMAPMAFVVSLTIAILCDVELRLEDGWVRRVTEGMLCGGAMAIAIFVFTHLVGIPSATHGRAPNWFPFVFSFSLGFASGLIAPYLYRQARSEGLALQAQPLAPMEGHTVPPSASAA